MPTIAPMLAKAVSEVPAHDSVEGGYAFEPKWDGFRAIVHVTADAVEIHGRSKPLTRYFPELVHAFSDMEPCILDGEFVLRSGPKGNERLDWELLSQRIHPADSRVQKLAVDTPAQFVAFDRLDLGLDLPFAERRTALEKLTLTPPIFRTQTTLDADEARRWLADFEGATWGEGWTATGSFAGQGPSGSTAPGTVGSQVLNSYVGGGDTATGTITSAPFTIDRSSLRFLIGGGAHPLGVEPATSVNLLVNGQPVRTATGNNDGTLRPVKWDLNDLAGQSAQLQVLDDATGAWGHLVVDQAVLSD